MSRETVSLGHLQNEKEAESDALLEMFDGFTVLNRSNDVSDHAGAGKGTH